MKYVTTAIVTLAFLLLPAISFSGSCDDVNNDATTNIFDITYLISYLYVDGPDPACGVPFDGICGDVNYDATVNIFDITYLITYLYLDGPSPNCDGSMLIDIDGNIYETVQIGDQLWMAENLKVTHYRNGDPIYNGYSGDTIGTFVFYHNDSDNIEIYGLLYNSYAVHEPRKIAPEGWHIATDGEWKQLEMFIGMSEEQADIWGNWERGDFAGKLKEVGYEHWEEPNAGATDEYGFTGLPGGYQSGGSASTMESGKVAQFYTATYSYYPMAMMRRLYYHFERIERGAWGNSYNGYGASSVRCILGDEPYGNIVIKPMPDTVPAPWTMYGPDSYSSSGVGYDTVSGLLPGEYTLVWEDTPNFWTPLDTSSIIVPYDIHKFSQVYYFKDSTGTVTDIDGNVYQTIKVGDKWWMAENLKVTHYRNGESIPNVTDDGTWSGLTSGAYCAYDNDPGLVETYGYLYNLYAVSDARNIAPSGWHVATESEWQELETFLGMPYADVHSTGWGRGTDEGNKLKEVRTIHWIENSGATDEIRFTALPGGFRSGGFSELTEDAYFWTDCNYTRQLDWWRSDICRTTKSSFYGLSVRCVKD